METRIVLVTIRYTHVNILGISVVTSCSTIVLASKSPVWKKITADDNNDDNDRQTKLIA